MFTWRWRKRRPPTVDDDAAPPYSPQHAKGSAPRRRPGGTVSRTDITRGGWQQ